MSFNNLVMQELYLGMRKFTEADTGKTSISAKI